MARRITKGERLNIGMDVFHVGLGWDVNDKASPFPFDLDVSAFMIAEATKKCPGDDYWVSYSSEIRVLPDNPTEIIPASHWSNDNRMRHESRPVDPELSVIGSLDDEDGATSEDGDDETMDINLNRVRPDISEIVICVSIFDYERRRQNFGQVERAYVRLFKPGQADSEIIYDLTEDFSACASVEFCSLYRHQGEWKIKAIGIGHRGGIEELCDKFGIEIL